jgi:hypothetical protein
MSLRGARDDQEGAFIFTMIWTGPSYQSPWARALSERSRAFLSPLRDFRLCALLPVRAIWTLVIGDVPICCLGG